MPSEKLKQFEPRKYHRVPHVMSVEVCHKNECITINTKDVSEGGMSFDARLTGLPEKFSVGGFVRVRPVDAPESSAMVGKIVRLNRQEMAIEFVYR